MSEFFQGPGVTVLLWLFNAAVAVALFFYKGRQALYERGVQKDVERLEKGHCKLEAELREYRDLLERRLKDGSETMRELVRCVEQLKAESQRLRSEQLPIPDFRVYCKEHENVHAEQARAVSSLLTEVGEVKRAVGEIDSYVKGGFQTVMKLLGQHVIVENPENPLARGEP